MTINGCRLGILFSFLPYSDEWKLSAPPRLFQLVSPRVWRQSVIGGHWVIIDNFFTNCFTPSMGSGADETFFLKRWLQVITKFLDAF
jgi:hypothetical protein